MTKSLFLLLYASIFDKMVSLVIYRLLMKYDLGMNASGYAGLLYEFLDLRRNFRTELHALIMFKEVQMVYRLFLVNCYLLHVLLNYAQPAKIWIL